MNDVVLTIGSNQFVLQPKEAIEVMEILMSTAQVESHWPKANDEDKRSHQYASWPAAIGISQLTGDIVEQNEVKKIKEAQKVAKELEEMAEAVGAMEPEAIEVEAPV